MFLGFPVLGFPLILVGSACESRVQAFISWFTGFSLGVQGFNVLYLSRGQDKILHDPIDLNP